MFRNNETTIMSVETNDSVTIVKEDLDGNFIVKQDGEVVTHCFSLQKALDVAATLLNRTQDNA